MERMQITESEYERLLVSYGQVTKEYDNTKQHLLNY